MPASAPICASSETNEDFKQDVSERIACADPNAAQVFSLPRQLTFCAARAPRRADNSSATRKASSSDWLAFNLGSQAVW